MPRYAYHCGECDGMFEVIHSMSEEQEECTMCTAVGNLQKVPSLIGALKPLEREGKVGDVVKKHIKEASQDLKDEKKIARKEFETK